LRRIFFLFTLAGCVKASHGDTAAGSKPDMTSSANPLNIEWKLDVADKTATIHYKITNPTKSRWYVCDKLISPGNLPKESYKAFEGLTIQGDNDTILLILGTTPPLRPAYRILPDTYVALEPGAVLEATRTMHWPFIPFNPHMSGVGPLPKNATKVSFMVYAFQGEPPTWRDWPGEDGNPVHAPEGMTLTPMTVGPIPLPK
jgi:hypothetical protein